MRCDIILFGSCVRDEGSQIKSNGYEERIGQVVVIGNVKHLLRHPRASSMKLGK